MATPPSPPLSPRPFAAAPDPSGYFPTSAMEEARQRIGRSIQRGEGPVLIIGAAGLGKTMLLEVIAQQFREQYQSVTIASGQLCTRRALLQRLLFELDLPYREMDESELRLSLLTYLQPQEESARRILLLVDEADALPPRLLEELRALTNLASGGQLLVHLVLAGNSVLEEQFADPKLKLFSQRISARCYLTAFGREETFQYVRAQLAASGTDPQLFFTDDGLEAIFAATDGVPRLVNQLGDQLLWMAAETGYAPLDGSIVQQAWSELQQLPAPWNTPSIEPKEPSSCSVEFGELPTEENRPAEIVFEESVFEMDTFEDAFEESDTADCDEDLPASIPISTHQHALKPSCIETMDVTEQLLEQLHVTDSATVEIEIPDDSTAEKEGVAKNPFRETFDSEEIVLDRYSTFDGLLLAEAPRVDNRTDTTFAQQLQQLEILETSKSALEPNATDEQEETSACLPEEFGDVLIIEENERPETTVVEGKKFRQLFSSLETGGAL